jgi:hypothetical protein
MMGALQAEPIADILRNPVKDELARGEVVASMTVRRCIYLRTSESGY